MNFAKNTGDTLLFDYLCLQVEYSYPPLVEGQPVDSHEIPTKWKHLPSLALPDGSHNYESGKNAYVI